MSEKKSNLRLLDGIEGRFYDELTDDEKQRWWHYVYEGVYTVKQAETIEKNFISGTLHFKCERSISDMDFFGDS